MGHRYPPKGDMEPRPEEDEEEDEWLPEDDVLLTELGLRAGNLP